MTREDAIALLKKCDTWECVPEKVIDKIYDYVEQLEAENAKLKAKAIMSECNGYEKRINQLMAELDSIKQNV